MIDANLPVISRVFRFVLVIQLTEGPFCRFLSRAKYMKLIQQNLDNWREIAILSHASFEW
jgi:hypothetical protein